MADLETRTIRKAMWRLLPFPDDLLFYGVS